MALIISMRFEFQVIMVLSSLVTLLVIYRDATTKGLFGPTLRGLWLTKMYIEFILKK